MLVEVRIQAIHQAECLAVLRLHVDVLQDQLLHLGHHRVAEIAEDRAERRRLAALAQLQSLQQARGLLQGVPGRQRVGRAHQVGDLVEGEAMLLVHVQATPFSRFTLARSKTMVQVVALWPAPRVYSGRVVK